MKPLNPTDQLFLWLEKRQQTMHVGGLQIFSFPDEAPDDYVARLAKKLRENTQVAAPFNQRLNSRLAPAAFHLLTGLAPKWQTFNVVISNVPGPKETRYWNGAKLEGMYPVSIAMDRLALNMTLTSYNGQVEFGLIGCRRTLPSLQCMLEYLEDGLVELEQGAVSGTSLRRYARKFDHSASRNHKEYQSGTGRQSAGR